MAGTSIEETTAAIPPDSDATAGESDSSRTLWIFLAIGLLAAAGVLVARLLRATRAPPPAPASATNVVRATRPSMGMQHMIAERRGEIGVGLLALGVAAVTAYLVISAPL